MWWPSRNRATRMGLNCGRATTTGRLAPLAYQVRQLFTVADPRPARDRGGRPAVRLRHKQTAMLRRFVAAAVLLLFAVGLILAEESKCKITKIDTEKGTTITVKVGDKDEMFRIGKRAKVLNDKGDEIKAD